MLSPDLEETLRRALSIAGERSHEFATLEHLLLALIDDEDALEVLQGCNVDISHLRDLLVSHIEDELSSIVNPSENLEVQPTAGFQRVVQRAIIHTQSSGRGAATGANILIAMYSERESYAVWFLNSLNMSRLDAVSFVSHGNGEPAQGTEHSDDNRVEGEAGKSEPLSEYAVDLMAKARAGFHGPMGTGINQFVKGMGGAEYIASLLAGYTGEEKEEFGTVFYENTAYPGRWIAMAPPLYGEDVDFDDGHSNELKYEAMDVAAFLTWAAEPKMMARKHVGFRAVLFLILLSALLYATNKTLWAPIKKRVV